MTSHNAKEDIQSLRLRIALEITKTRHRSITKYGFCRLCDLQDVDTSNVEDMKRALARKERK